MRRAFELYGTTDIPVDTFNKVWILPQEAQVLEKNILGPTESMAGAAALVTRAHLKVMLENDYLAASKNPATEGDKKRQQEEGSAAVSVQDLSREILREVIVPLLETEINEGVAFAPLRQVYASLILAAWYKRKVKESLLSSVYVDQNKVLGVDSKDPGMSARIWAQYVAAFKQGPFNYVKEEEDPYSGDLIPRHYFSGGFSGDMSQAIHVTDQFDRAQLNDAIKNPVQFRVDLNGVNGAAAFTDVNFLEALDQIWQEETNLEVWTKVAWELGRIGGERAVDILDMMRQKFHLQSAPPLEAVYEIYASLAHIGTARSLALLVEEWKGTSGRNNAFIKPQIIKLLGEQGTALSLQTLEALEREPEFNITNRHLLAAALGNIGSHETTKQNIRDKALDMLDRLRQEQKNTFVLSAVAEALGKIGGLRSLTMLDKMREDIADDHLADSLVEAVGIIGQQDQNNQALVQSVYRTINKMRKAESFRASEKKIIQTLGVLGGMSALTVFNNMLEEDVSIDAVNAIILALGQMGSGRGSDYGFGKRVFRALGTMRQKQHPECAKNMAWALGQIGGSLALKELELRGQEDNSPDVQLMIVDAISWIDINKVWERIEPLISKQNFVQSRFVDVISRLDKERAVEILKKLWVDNKISAADMIEALENIGSVAAGDVLENIFYEIKDPVLMEKIVSVLTYVPSTTEMLKKMYIWVRSEINMKQKDDSVVKRYRALRRLITEVIRTRKETPVLIMNDVKRIYITGQFLDPEAKDVKHWTKKDWSEFQRKCLLLLDYRDPAIRRKTLDWLLSLSWGEADDILIEHLKHSLLLLSTDKVRIQAHLSQSVGQKIVSFKVRILDVVEQGEERVRLESF
jgi:HEAT repeat protein